MIRTKIDSAPLVAILFSLGLGACGPDPALEQEEMGSEGSPGVVAASDAGTAGDDHLPEWVGTETELELSEEEMGAIQLETASAEHRSIASRLPVMGRVLAHQHRRAIVSYPFSARIASIEARVGDWVRPGDPLVVLQSEEVGVATSAFYSANADHELAQVNFERENQLFESGVAARKNLSAAETQLRVAAANLNATEKKLHVLGFTEEQMEVLRETHQVNPNITLFAPIAGKIVTNTAVLGAMVDETTEILTIMNPTTLWAEAEIYERDISRVRTGQAVEVAVPAFPDDVFRGTISYIADVLHPETRTITVRTEVANTDLKLKPGMFADLVIELNENGHAVSVPDAAVLDDHGLPFVFVVHDGHHFLPRLVTTGASGGGYVEIVRGLELGDQVVTRGNFQLKSKLYEAVLEAGHIH
ncbi:MAG: efflux RND transporter periplasmic adaptor subunit [Gemmatimonadetes bacterium]|nr:efflux RND transporter periplasmic adaptor subunit [Gemmatimonadota bacterium]